MLIDINFSSRIPEFDDNPNFEFVGSVQQYLFYMWVGLKMKVDLCFEVLHI